MQFLCITILNAAIMELANLVKNIPSAIFIHKGLDEKLKDCEQRKMTNTVRQNIFWF